MSSNIVSAFAVGGRCHVAATTTRHRRVDGTFCRAAAATDPSSSSVTASKKKTTAAPAVSHLARHHQRRGRGGGHVAPRSTSPISPFAKNGDEEKEEQEEGVTTAPSPELARAQRALRWRHRNPRKENAGGSENNDDVATAQTQPLDVYTEALLVACEDGGGDDLDDASASVAADAADDTAAATAAEGWSSAGIASVLDHLAFDRLQVIMEKTEVSKGVEVMGMMRQVVVVGSGLDTRAFRIPWPRGTAIFELAHRDVHDFAAATLRAVGAKPSRGCSHRRVPCDPTVPETQNYEYGDMEDAMLRAGYAPDIPSLWILQDVGAMGARDDDKGEEDGRGTTAESRRRRWLDLAEEVADLMCAGSEVVGHVPTRRGWAEVDGGGNGGGKSGKTAAFGAPLAQDMASAGVLARAYQASEIGVSEEDGGGEDGGEQQHGQLGIFHGVKQRPSKQEAEYYREQIYIAEFELGDEEGFED